LFYSVVDDNTANSNKIPSVILDYGRQGDRIFGGHAPDVPYVISYAGMYDQRL